jgi:hypothetical protein
LNSMGACRPTCWQSSTGPPRAIRSTDVCQFMLRAAARTQTSVSITACDAGKTDPIATGASGSTTHGRPVFWPVLPQDVPGHASRGGISDLGDRMAAHARQASWAIWSWPLLLLGATGRVKGLDPLRLADRGGLRRHRGHCSQPDGLRHESR